MHLKAIVFDCDGVLADTERDAHRVAFNRAFEKKGVNAHWDVDLYGKLLQVGGGKERLRRYFDEQGWPGGFADRHAFLNELHAVKTDLFMQIIEAGELPLRTGVKRLVDEALDAGIKLAVCSTSNERSVNCVLEVLLGRPRKLQFSAILAGDVVTRKKPDPEIYNLAKQRLGVPGHACVVIEDTRIGLLAAKSAGMHCLITTNVYTRAEDFAEADRVVAELGDPPAQVVTLQDLRELARQVPSG